MKIRTPDERFENLPGYSFEPHYLEINGLRVHYLDEGNPTSDTTVVCLHGEPSWSYLYRKMIPILSEHYRVIAPDFIGFGRSDKYTDKKQYSFQMHSSTLSEFMERLDLHDTTFVVQDWGGLIGLPYAADHPDRVTRLVIMNTGLPDGSLSQIKSFKDLRGMMAFLAWRRFASSTPDLPIGRVINFGTYKPFNLPKEVVRAYNAPFPDSTYKAGASAWPRLVPLFRWSPGAQAMRTAREKLSQWHRPALIMFSDKDPVTQGQEKFFYHLIPGAKKFLPITIRDAGHFLQEDKGEELAVQIVKFIQAS